MLLVTILMVVGLSSIVFGKYILTQNFGVKVMTSPFYFDVTIDKDYAELDVNKADFGLVIKNYISDTKYNNYDVTYEISIDNENFEVELVDNKNGIINGNKSENSVIASIVANDVPNLSLEQNVIIKVKTLTPYTKEFELPITIINNASLIGDYVDYGVAYTDIYSGYEFSSTEGWRILDYGTRNEDGTYSNTKIITTGIPLKLYYNASQNPATSSNKNSKWWGTTDEVNERYGLSLKAWESGKSRYFAAYGLEYNFASIPFSGTANTTKNAGYYTKVNNPEAPNTTTGAIFLNNDAKSVHAVTVEEMNKVLNSVNGDTSRTETKLGTVNATVDLRNIFYLRALNNYNYTTSITAPYWLGSPNDDNTGLVRFQAAGTFSGGTDNTYGVRPVITLNKKIYNNNGIWRIVE